MTSSSPEVVSNSGSKNTALNGPLEAGVELPDEEDEGSEAGNNFAPHDRSSSREQGHTQTKNSSRNACLGLAGDNKRPISKPMVDCLLSKRNRLDGGMEYLVKW